MPAIFTRKHLVATVAERWAQQYSERGWGFVGMRGNRRDSREIYERLLAATTEEEITQIIGNPSWTSLKCSVCEEEQQVIVGFEDGDGDYTKVCNDCMEAAIIDVNNTE